MPELSPKQIADVPRLMAALQADYPEFVDCDSFRGALSFMRGGVPVDDVQALQQLHNHNNRKTRGQQKANASEALEATQLKVQRRTLEDPSDKQRRLLFDMIVAVEEATMPEGDPDLVEDTNVWPTDAKRSRRRGSNLHETSKLISRGFAVIEDLGVEFERPTETTTVSDDEQTIGATLSDGTTVDMHGVDPDADPDDDDDSF